MKEVEWDREREEVPMASMVTFSEDAFEPRSEG
jgi:hypothetical protein